jgi:biotin carboxyl carrier protein
MKIVIGDQEFEVQPSGDTVTIGDAQFAVRVVRSGSFLTVYVNEKPFAVQVQDTGTAPEEGPVKLLVDAKQYEVELKGKAGARPRPKAARKPRPAGAAGAVSSQMTGRVIKVNVKPGDSVSEGDVLLVVEAMKMENEITSPLSGTVKEVSVAAGARVSEGDMLVLLEPAAS